MELISYFIVEELGDASTFLADQSEKKVNNKK
jgi:hypothetical protein